MDKQHVEWLERCVKYLQDLKQHHEWAYRKEDAIRNLKRVRRIKNHLEKAHHEALLLVEDSENDQTGGVYAGIESIEYLFHTSVDAFVWSKLAESELLYHKSTHKPDKYDLQKTATRLTVAHVKQKDARITRQLVKKLMEGASLEIPAEKTLTNWINEFQDEFYT
ncbi:MAG: hypothetical protein AB2697_22650 [Candidatus Thiodiazotropha endolucinida]